MIGYMYILVINVVAFVLFGVDKRKAKKGQWRISENTLLLAAATGGSIGAFIGMKVFRHKTKKIKFFIGIPLLFIAQVILSVVYYRG